MNRLIRPSYDDLDSVKGTTPREEYDLLYPLLEELPMQGVIVEIGTGGGRLTALFGDVCRQRAGHLITIDNNREFERYGWFAQTARMTVSRFDLTRYVEFIQSDSFEAVKQIKVPVDFLFVDGSHFYEDVRNDLSLYPPLVKGGGWMAGHDFDPNCSDGRQVIKALVETIMLPFEDFHVNRRMWWKRKET